MTHQQKIAELEVRNLKLEEYLGAALKEIEELKEEVSRLKEIGEYYEGSFQYAQEKLDRWELIAATMDCDCWLTKDEKGC